MKTKYLILFILLIPMTASAWNFDSDLYFGLQENKEVMKLQEFLTEGGFYNGPITGNFFSLTKLAVRKFQSSFSVEPISGYFGPKSRVVANKIFVGKEALNTSTTTNNGVTASTVPQGSSGNVINLLTEQIRILQQQLETLRQQQVVLQQQSQTLQQIQQQTLIQSPLPSQTPESIEQPSQARIEIFSPNPRVGIGKRIDPVSGIDLGYRALPDGCRMLNGVHNEVDCQYGDSNFINLGAVIFNADGSNSKTAVVTVKTTDSEQDKIINGTGSLSGSSEPFAGNYFYTFSYFFRTSGIHTISFSANGLSKTVTLVVP